MLTKQFERFRNFLHSFPPCVHSASEIELNHFGLFDNNRIHNTYSGCDAISVAADGLVMLEKWLDSTLMRNFSTKPFSTLPNSIQHNLNVYALLNRNRVCGGSVLFSFQQRTIARVIGCAHDYLIVRPIYIDPFGCLFVCRAIWVLQHTASSKERHPTHTQIYISPSALHLVFIKFILGFLNCAPYNIA